jgi:hypothetical protein
MAKKTKQTAAGLGEKTSTWVIYLIGAKQRLIGYVNAASEEAAIKTAGNTLGLPVALRSKLLARPHR